MLICLQKSLLMTLTNEKTNLFTYASNQSIIDCHKQLFYLEKKKEGVQNF